MRIEDVKARGADYPSKPIYEPQNQLYGTQIMRHAMEGLSTNIGSEKYVDVSSAVSAELATRPRTNNALERGQSMLRHFNAESLATFK